MLFVSPGAGGKDPCIVWCFKIEEAVLLSSSSSSSDAEPIRESGKKEKIEISTFSRPKGTAGPQDLHDECCRIVDEDLRI